MNLSRRAALRATLSGLHAGTVLAGTECVLVWAAFRWSPAAIVGGLAYVVGGVLARLAYPRTVGRTRRVILMRGLRVYVYSMALILAGALFVRSGTHHVAVDRMRLPELRTVNDGQCAPCGGSGQVSPAFAEKITADLDARLRAGYADE